MLLSLFPSLREGRTIVTIGSAGLESDCIRRVLDRRMPASVVKAALNRRDASLVNHNISTVFATFQTGRTKVRQVRLAMGIRRTISRIGCKQPHDSKPYLI